MRQKQLEEQKLKRCEESSIAYKKWQDKSKNIPKPATQGLLRENSNFFFDKKKGSILPLGKTILQFFKLLKELHQT